MKALRLLLASGVIGTTLMGGLANAATLSGVCPAGTTYEGAHYAVGQSVSPTDQLSYPPNVSVSTLHANSVGLLAVYYVSEVTPSDVCEPSTWHSGYTQAGSYGIVNGNDASGSNSQSRQPGALRAGHVVTLVTETDENGQAIPSSSYPITSVADPVLSAYTGPAPASTTCPDGSALAGAGVLDSGLFSGTLPDPGGNGLYYIAYPAGTSLADACDLNNYEDLAGSGSPGNAPVTNDRVYSFDSFGSQPPYVPGSSGAGGGGGMTGTTTGSSPSIVDDPLAGKGIKLMADATSVFLQYVCGPVIAIVLCVVAWRLILGKTTQVLLNDGKMTRVHHSIGDKVKDGDGDEWAQNGFHYE